MNFFYNNHLTSHTNNGFKIIIGSQYKFFIPCVLNSEFIISSENHIVLHMKSRLNMLAII